MLSKLMMLNLRNHVHADGVGPRPSRACEASLNRASNTQKHRVMLLDLQHASVEQGDLDPNTPAPDQSNLMTTVDAVNQRYGRGALKVASTAMASDRRIWEMRQSLKTPNYTTCWEDLPVARA